MPCGMRFSPSSRRRSAGWAIAASLGLFAIGAALLLRRRAPSYDDLLVIATGVVLQPEETEGLTGPGWREKVFTFYEVPGAEQLAHAQEARQRLGDSIRVKVEFVDAIERTASGKFRFLVSELPHEELQVST